MEQPRLDLDLHPPKATADLDGRRKPLVGMEFVDRAAPDIEESGYAVCIKNGALNPHVRVTLAVAARVPSCRARLLLGRCPAEPR